MSAHLLSFPGSPAHPPSEPASPLTPAELATARYVDREIEDARATARLCGAASARARFAGRSLLAGVLGDIRRDLAADAALLSPAARPEIRWPRRATAQVDDDAGVEPWLEAVDESLQHSARILRWVAGRPDLSPVARTMFATLASSREVRRRLLLVCMAVDDGTS
jgi:hypothetical protein